MTIRIVLIALLFGSVLLAGLAEWIGEQIKN
jgi:hypothetical protein